MDLVVTLLVLLAATPPVPPGAISSFTPEPRTPVPAPRVVQGAVGTSGIAPRGRVLITRRPENNDGIWIRFRGERWVHAGPAVPMASAAFVRVGEYSGVPVYARRESRDAIYLPTSDGARVTPYRLKIR